MDKRNMRKLAFGAGIAVGSTAVVWAWINRRLFTVTEVVTGESSAYPALRSRVYYASREAVLAAAEISIRDLRGWRVVRTDADSDTLDAEVEVIGGILDDVTIYVQPLNLGQTRVAIRSRSRQGCGDLGSNAHHIRTLQDVMDRRLQTGAAI